VRLRPAMRGNLLGNTIGLAIAVALVAYLLFEIAATTSGGERQRAERQHVVLLHELHRIPTAAGTSFVDDEDWFSQWKPHLVTVGAQYRTRRPREELVAHYDEQMGSRGFRFKRPIAIKDYGRNTNMQEQVYCKGDLEVHLTYDTGGEYFLSLWWREGDLTVVRRWLDLPPVPIKDCFGNRTNGLYAMRSSRRPRAIAVLPLPDCGRSRVPRRRRPCPPGHRQTHRRLN
jgi:hypothetical protein